VTVEPAAPSTRERALEAGLAVWVDTEPATLFGGLNVSRVAKRAGITRATFYTYWATAQEYLDELVTYSSGGVIDVDDVLAADLVRLTLGRDAISDQIFQSAVRTVEALVADPAFRLRLAMLSKGDDPVVAAKLREQYAAAEATVTKMFSQLLDGWGRAVRPPLDMRAMVALLASQLEGYSARAIVDPELATPELYGHAIVAHLLTLTTPRRMPGDIGEITQIVDRWPDDADRSRLAASRAGSPLPRPDTAFDAIGFVRTTRMAIAERSWPELTLEHLARRESTTPSVVIAHFGSKHGLGVAVLELLAREALDELPCIEDPLQRLRLRLRTVANLLNQVPALSYSAMMIYTGMAQVPAAGVLTWGVTPIMAEAFAAAMAAGQLDDQLDPFEAAIMVGCAMVCRATAHNTTDTYGPGDPAEYILRGMGATPDPAGLSPDLSGGNAGR
jgi:AcrR family transcriptional regulator